MQLSQVVRHLSASSLNTYKADPVLWAVQYLFKVRGTMSVQAARGIGTETGVAAGLKDPNLSVEDCIQAAVEDYNAKTALTPQGHEMRDKQRNIVQGYTTSRSEYPGTVRVALDALRPMGKPTGHGEKISVHLHGIDVPVIGFKDFSFDDKGFSVDLKTTERIPSEIPQDHRLQVSIYHKASDNQAQRLAYTSAKECLILELTSEQARDGISEATHIATVLRDALAAADTPEDFVRSHVPDFTNFRWHDSARQKASEILGY